MTHVKYFLTFVLINSLVFNAGLLFAQDAESEFSLEALLDMEVSTAAKYKQKVSDAAASITIITSEDIERYGYRSLAEVFESVRGFYTSYDRNYSYTGVRGFGRPTDYNNRMLVLINGQVTNDGFYNSASVGFALPVNLDVVERIEIVRGPGSALYGTSAMLAVINVITKKNATFDGFKISANLGSFGAKNSSLSFGREFENEMSLMAFVEWSDNDGQDLYFKDFNDAATNNGMAIKADWSRYLKFLTTLEYKNLKMQAIYNSFEKGVPTAPYETKFNADTWTVDDYHMIQLEYTDEIAQDVSVQVKGNLYHYSYDGKYPYEDEEDGEVYSYNSWDANDVTQIGTNMQLLWDMSSSNRIIGGLEYQNLSQADYRYWDEWETYFDQDFPHHVYSAYLQNEYQPLENVSFIAGMRWDSYSDRGNSISPRLAAIFSPFRKSTFKVLYGEAFRVPSLYEVYYEDPVYGQKVSNNLKSEVIKTTELVFEQQITDWLYSTVSLFFYDMENLIDTDVDPTDSLILFQNVNEVHASGLEFELRTQFENGLRGYANYSFQDAEDTELKSRITNSPIHLIKAGFVHPLWDYFFIGSEFYYESERKTVYDTKTKPYFLTNINLSSKKLFDHLTLSLRVRNLFDKKYAQPGGYEHIQDAIVQDGRTLLFRTAYDF